MCSTALTGGLRSDAEEDRSNRAATLGDLKKGRRPGTEADFPHRAEMLSLTPSSAFIQKIPDSWLRLTKLCRQWARSSFCFGCAAGLFSN
jgi:hypothetical protein